MHLILKASVHLDDDAIMARLKKLTPLAKAMLVPSLTGAEIKVALEEDEVTDVSSNIEVISVLRCTK